MYSPAAAQHAEFSQALQGFRRLRSSTAAAPGRVDVPRRHRWWRRRPSGSPRERR